MNDNERKLNVNVHEGQWTFEIGRHEKPVLYIIQVNRNIKKLNITTIRAIRNLKKRTAVRHISLRFSTVRHGSQLK